jgi:hypothetical protein
MALLKVPTIQRAATEHPRTTATASDPGRAFGPLPTALKRKPVQVGKQRAPKCSGAEGRSQLRNSASGRFRARVVFPSRRTPEATRWGGCPRMPPCGKARGFRESGNPILHWVAPNLMPGCRRASPRETPPSPRRGTESVDKLGHCAPWQAVARCLSFCVLRAVDSCDEFTEAFLHPLSLLPACPLSRLSPPS